MGNVIWCLKCCVCFIGFLLIGNLLLDRRRGKLDIQVSWRGRCRRFKPKQLTSLHNLPFFRSVLQFWIVAFKLIDVNLFITCFCQWLMEPSIFKNDIDWSSVWLWVVWSVVTTVYGTHIGPAAYYGL
jgi:hypothetical protein